MKAILKSHLSAILLIVSAPILALFIAGMIKFAYTEDPNAPTQSYVGTVVRVDNKIFSDAFNGTQGYCTLTIQTLKVGQLTISPDWHECVPIAIGDKIKIWRQQYSLDMKGQWKDWRVIPSTDI